MVISGQSETESPFHPGEKAIQSKLGVQKRSEKVGKDFIREYLTEEHQEFFSQLPYVIVGTVDSSGDVWASILVGKPRFIEVKSDRYIQVKAKPLSGDPLESILAEGIDIGMLGIEFAARRRNRLNGKVSAIDADGFEVSVIQSFGNCPQYIQARTIEELSIKDSSLIREIASFEEVGSNLIKSSDTLFIATAYQAESAGSAGGVDISHRGGKPGFVRIDGDSILTIPDFRGNNFYNTLGNIQLNPHAGLLFIDFATGDLLSVTGDAEIVWSGEEIERYEGAERLVRFHLKKGYWMPNILNMRWTSPQFSPQLKKTGSW